MNLYLTCDRIGTPTGGGAVTYHEYAAFSSMGEETHPLDGARFPYRLGDPFQSDDAFLGLIRSASGVKLAHIYAGCFTNTVYFLKGQGAKVTYTAAAHDIDESRREFEELGIPFDFPHLTQPDLWEKYVAGYKAADLVICPSTLSKKCMEAYGCKNVIVIPHGHSFKHSGHSPRPKNFTVGYLGQAGPDKGLRYLFEAWKKLGMKDGLLLVAGNNIDQALPLWRKFGGGNVEFMGFVKGVDEFYDRITVYVQPSVTEGFGIEVLEAMVYGRPPIVSKGAGAVDVTLGNAGLNEGEGWAFPPRDVHALAELIEGARKCRPERLDEFGVECRKVSARYTWDDIGVKYQNAWKALI